MSELLTKLERAVATLPPDLPEEDYVRLSAEVRELRERVQRQAITAGVFTLDWPAAKFLKLKTVLYPKKAGRHRGTRIPSKWLAEMDRRCSPNGADLPTTAARAIIEESGDLQRIRERHGKARPEDYPKALKNRADHLVSVWQQRNLSRRK